MEENKVILPMSEYEELKRCREDMRAAIEELKKDCKERGFYVEYKLIFNDYRNPCPFDVSRINIISKDDVLNAAADEIERLSRGIKEKDDEINRLLGRSLWRRILNREGKK